MLRGSSAAYLASLLLAVARVVDARPGATLFDGASDQLFSSLKSLLHLGGWRGVGLEPPVLSSASTTALTVSWDAADGASSYALYADSWWANDGKMATVYSGADTSFTVPSLMPGTPTHVLVAALAEDGSELGRSDAVALTTQNADHCGNQADATAWRADYGALSTTITACIENCVVEGEDCVACCVHAKTGMSNPCSTCWGQYYDCAESNCFTKCAFSPSSKSCHDCSKKYCLGGAKKCVGIPEMFWPPDIDSVTPKMTIGNAGRINSGGGGADRQMQQQR